MIPQQTPLYAQNIKDSTVYLVVGWMLAVASEDWQAVEPFLLPLDTASSAAVTDDTHDNNQYRFTTTDPR